MFILWFVYRVRGQFILRGATLNRLSYGERDSNGAETNKDNCFEIIQAGEKKGDTIHVESTSDFNTWMSQIERQINPERCTFTSEVFCPCREVSVSIA